MEICYRTPQHCDAQAFWNMLFNLDRETSYMLYEPDERGKSLDKIEAFIDSVNEGQDFLRVAVNNGEIVGYISAQRGRMSRIKHTAYITVGIRSKHRGARDRHRILPAARHLGTRKPHLKARANCHVPQHSS